MIYTENKAAKKQIKQRFFDNNGIKSGLHYNSRISFNRLFKMQIKVDLPLFQFSCKMYGKFSKK